MKRIFEATAIVAIFPVFLVCLLIPVTLFLALNGHFQMAKDCMVLGEVLLSLTALCLVTGLVIRIMQ